MGELLPTLTAASVEAGLLEYLETTFGLSDQVTREALSGFLQDPVDGIFKGPYLRIRMPFEAAGDGWQRSLSWWPDGFTPYGHQAAAFARLGCGDLSPGKPAPQATLVTTGTGSGKTESFLVPILDHVLRAKARGEGGIKALLLYPMNALANDQAQRLTELITTDPRLDGVTAGLYTGEQGSKRTRVSSAGLITDRHTLRDTPPDILLTNYKMLDQLLLRDVDQKLWQESATSLQYLVLDEFHTYDGAQGTDVAMLLRRLGLALRAYGRDDAPLTPVATSATLGDKGDPSAMLEFAETVFGVAPGEDAVVGESRVAIGDWIHPDELPGSVDGPRLVQAINEALDELDAAPEPAELTARIVDALYEDADSIPHGTGVLVRAHPLTRRLLEATREATPLADLVDDLFTGADPVAAQRALAGFVAALSHLRREYGRGWPAIDVHLWVRELTRIDREAAAVPNFAWADDGGIAAASMDSLDMADARFQGPSLPAIYCRHCGGSGWMVRVSPAKESDLDLGDENIRADHTLRKGRTRPVLHAPREGEIALDGGEAEPNLHWFYLRQRQVLVKRPEGSDAHDGSVLPVLTHMGEDADDASAKDTCPSCRQRDSIRFLGAAIATQLSVALSTIFGSTELDPVEKKTLVFTDSVQDAAHRAGFVQSRSHSLTVRSMLRDAMGEEPVELDRLADLVIERAGNDSPLRFRMLPPTLAEQEGFAEFWQARTRSKISRSVRTRVRRRLAFDAAMEFGLRSRVGRTLETTGTVGVEVIADRGPLLSAARHALRDTAGDTLAVLEADDARLLAWSRGVLERMRERGAIEHEWFDKLIKADGNRYWIWRGRRRSEGMPAFPRGAQAPAYPRIGKPAPVKDPVLDSVTGTQTWYTDWTRRVLGITALEASSLVGRLFPRLAGFDLISETNTDSEARVYAIRQSSVLLTPISDTALAKREHLLQCDHCQAQTPGGAVVITQLSGAPCLVARCRGKLAPVAGEPGNFYRRFYSSKQVQRVVAREHTSMLDDKVRLEYENGFKASDAETPNAPNVLVATPTLEMGIDIGALSTVMLSSLPRTVASYQQRVGRGGRRHGSSLALAFVTGRGDQLPQLGEPGSLINGEVRPPATYLEAEEILRRQYLASLADLVARQPAGPHPKNSAEAMTWRAGGWLQALASLAEQEPATVETFLAEFADLSEETRERLRVWTRPVSGEHTSPLAQKLIAESGRWKAEIDELSFRIAEIEKELPELERLSSVPAATDDDRHQFHTARATHRLAKKQRADLQGRYWISVAEAAGLLPNYTLVDDSVQLDVALQWVEPETGAFEADQMAFVRNAAQGLRDFAPRARFYARGYRVEIDAVDLGNREESIRTSAFCPACGYRTDITSSDAPARCPRCGSSGVADVRQRIDVVELAKSSSVMRRDEAVIDDRDDQRERTSFDIRFLADIDPAKVTRQWFVKDYGFGVKHLRNIDLTWLNVGRRNVSGSIHLLCGDEVDAELFRVCSQCGKLDQNTAHNSRYEHRPWCSLRNATDEESVTVALSRSLRTEGLVIRLPPGVSVGNSFALPSLEAALKLGLREYIGGAPDHLAVEVVQDPELGGDGHDDTVSEALLLHDLVPGGTGYLVDLADHQVMREILVLAYEVVQACECQREGRLACHRCLLPFQRPGGGSQVSRVEAERHLRNILGSDSDNIDLDWDITQVSTSTYDPESKLEQRFRASIVERLKDLGASVKEHPGSVGSRYTITLGGRSWSLEPQVSLGHTVPDFVLRSSDGGIPGIAIYCDGWRWHASPDTNKIAEDAKKRAVLRDQGWLVVAVTWAELEGETGPPPWLDTSQAILLANQFRLAITPAHVDVIAGSALDLLMWWIQRPDVGALQEIGKLVPFLLLGRATESGGDSGGSLAETARGLLEGSTLPAGQNTWGYRDDTLVVLSRLTPQGETETAVVLDDVDVGVDRQAAWASWLRFANLLGGRGSGVTVAAKSTSVELPAVAGKHRLDVISSADYEADLLDSERQALDQLRAAGIEEPAVGEEIAGIPVLGWMDRQIAIDIGEFNDVDRADLARVGWTVVSMDLDQIRTALKGTRS